MQIHGGCHCANIGYILDWRGEGSTIAARECGCSFCVKHGGAWTSNRDARLAVTVRDPAAVSRYSFGTGTAEFHVCSRCGVTPLVTSTIDGTVYAVVNVNTFDGVDRRSVARAPADFEGEDTEARLARRRRNWIADVRFTGAA